jgi:hypothetical protein
MSSQKMESRRTSRPRSYSPIVKQSPVTYIKPIIPFVIQGSELHFCLLGEILQVGCSHYWNFPFHLGSKYDIFDKVRDAVDGGFEVIDSGREGLIENLQRLCYSKVD